MTLFVVIKPLASGVLQLKSFQTIVAHAPFRVWGPKQYASKRHIAYYTRKHSESTNHLKAEISERK